VPGDPSDAELSAFAESLLRDLGQNFHDEEALNETIGQNRELWVMLYHVTLDDPDSS
jgi:hypothetical protein